MIPDEAVEAAKAVFGGKPPRGMRAALQAAAPHLLSPDAAYLQEKLDALSRWADAMIDESYYPQYGRDVKTIIDTPNELWRDS